MDPSITSAALILGLILGSLMLISVVFVFAKHQAFGMGGTLMTPFGVLLLGLSIWKTAEISVTPEGGLAAKFESLEQQVADINEEQKTTSEQVRQVSNQSQRFNASIVALQRQTQVLDQQRVALLKDLDTSKQAIKALQLRRISPGARVERLQ